MKKKNVILFSIISLFLTFDTCLFLTANVQANERVVIAIFSGPEADAHFKLSPIFEEFTGLSVEIEELSRDMYRQKLLASLLGKSGDYDVVFVPFENVPEHFDAGTLAPLDPYLKRKDLYIGKMTPKSYNLNDFPKASLNWMTYKGQLYGIPQEVFTHYYHYRKDILKELGIEPPPSTGYSWSQFVSVSQKLTRDTNADGTIDMYGTAVPGRVSGTLGAFFITNLWRKGVDLFDSKMNPIPDEKKAVEAIKEYLNLINLSIVPPGVPAGYAWGQLNICMQEQLCASAIQWNSGSAVLADSIKSPDIAGKVGYAIMPYDDTRGPKSSRSFSGVHGLYIAADSKNKENAFKYIAWFTSQPIARITATEGGGSSGRRSILQDPKILEKFPWYKTMNETLALTGKSMPRISQLGYLFNPVFATNFEAILTGSKTPEQGIKDIKNEMKKALNN